MFLLNNLLPHDLVGVLRVIPKGQLLDKITTMGQRLAVTSVSAPCSLRTFNTGKSSNMKEITYNVGINDEILSDFQGPFEVEAQLRLNASS